jgi:two-component system sensor histidine kinase HydH
METEGQREIRIIDEEVDRLRILADRVGDYLKDPVGNPEVFDAVEEIREITARFEGPIPISAAERETILIRFDRLRFRSVVENLLKNGRESGGDEIKVSVVRKKRQVEILITDCGKGLPCNSTDTGNTELFNPFYTTKEQGSGIGLAISLRFVEAAQGALRLEPRENGGAVAIVNLPAVEK